MQHAQQRGGLGYWISDRLFLGLSFGEYLRRLITPFNVIAGLIILPGLVLLVMRYTRGVGMVTAASQDQPWGYFLGYGLFGGVPLSATGFLLGTAVYVFNLRDYHPVVRNAVLVGFIGYLWAVFSLLIDLGRPWRIPYPILLTLGIGLPEVSLGTASVLFLVGWHVLLYLSCQFFEFSPAICEWGGWRTLRSWMVALTIGLTILGIILSTLHQSALGAMFLLMPGRLHPLWYTPYLPWLFLASAVVAGLCMVIFVTWFTTVFLRDRADPAYLASVESITLGLGEGASFALITYFALKLVALAHGHHWDLLGTPFGYWFLFEITIFVLLPWFLFVFAGQRRSVGLVQFTALLTLIGILSNRLTVAVFAFDWQLLHRELFEWKEIAVIIAMFTLQILVYRWIVNRMPVLREHPEYAGEPD